tara:strand:+ start:2268 stop:2531 length:264 start_codon:yes stop_codon:yes gene_type:complete
MYSQEKERLDMTLMSVTNVEILKEIVECEVADLFTDFIEGGQGIGSSDITACMNACVPYVNGRFDIDLNVLRDLIHDAICDLEEELA